MWNETAEQFIVDISQLDEAIVAFGGLKVSAFARERGEIYLDYFDDSVTMVRFHQQLFSVAFFFIVPLFSDQPELTGRKGAERLVGRNGRKSVRKGLSVRACC